MKTVPFKDAPKEWIGRVNCTDKDLGYTECPKCNKLPSENGDDHCISSLGNVINACCGHGEHKGYIQFDNGITIRGYFEIEKD